MTRTLKDKITLNHELITEAITDFYNKHVNSISDDEHVIVLFRIRTVENVILTIGQLQKINKNDLNYLIEYVEGVLYIKSDEYMEEIIQDIIFSFGIRKGMIENNAIDHYDTKPRYQYYKHYKLAATMDPNKYGTILHEDTQNKLYLVQVTPLTIAKIKKVYTENKWIANDVEIFKNGIKLLSYRDSWLDDRHFKRTIGNNIYYFSREGDMDLFTVWKPTRYIKKTKSSNKLDTKIVTLDIETKVVNNQHQPYLICYHDGKDSYSFYLTDYESPDNMIKACISSLLVAKYNKHKVYIHNLANFDGVFLLRNLVTFGELKVLLNKGKLISIDLEHKIEDKEIQICFRDSYQILLASLKKLGKSFNIDTQKSIFPYRFVNESTNFYNINKVNCLLRKTPDISWFNDITPQEYNEYISKLQLQNISENVPRFQWDLKKEAIKYCINDCISLYEILIKFNEMFFDKFHININEHPTLPGLAFRLFRTKYLNDNKIPMIYGDNYKKLKLSYTGGATDMYIPTNENEELVYAYDVNSLYPFIMANYPMPIGNLTYFEGDIRKHDKEAFGFFYCKIEAPNNLQHPILQTHVKTKGGLRTIAGIGTYHDMIFSNSYDTAIKAGYKIKILWGYTFEKGYIFKDYVNDLYKMRLEYPKSDPMNYIAKINLNSLYGKFGMRDDFDVIKIVDAKEFDKILNQNQSQVNDIIKLDKHFLVQLKNQDRLIPDEFITKDYNINVAIASAITSYSRDYMSQFKNNPKLKLFYSDTDSIYTNLSPDQMNELYPDIVSDKGLGKLKLENIFKKVIFLAPKCYAMETIDGELIVKVKGLMKKVPLTMQDFQNLLKKDSFIEKFQEKWFKSLSEGTITVLNQSYKLRQTDNKRELINQKIINDSIDNFWLKVVKKIKPNNHLFILFRVKTSDHYLTLGYLQKINLNDKEYFKKYILDIFNLKDDSYKKIYIDEIIISYGIREGKIIRSEVKQTSNFQNYKHFKLPVTMNPLEYGYVIFQSEGHYIVEINTGTIATIHTKEATDKSTKYNLVSIHRNKNLLFTYKDISIDDNSFKRIVNKRIYIYSKPDDKLDYGLDLMKIEKPARFIVMKKKDTLQNQKIITLDLETYKDKDGGLTPYLISWFDGKKHQSYYLSDFKSSNEMITKALTDLKRAKYHNHKIYVHNLAGFDGFFIVKELASLGFLTPIIHEGKIISLKLTFSNEKDTKSFSLLILDSLQMLLTSLKKLCKSFNLEIDKGLFPHNFVKCNNLNYIGTIPSYDNFINLKYEEYEEYSKSFNNDWNLRNEAIKYCQQDCLTLYQIMSKFNDLMFNNLKIDITKYPTISSLAMGLFRMHYLNEDIKIAMISGQVYKDIKQSYTGGGVDMYIPTNEPNELVYAYDVNSLYPYVMSNFKLPSGKPMYFEGDIKKQNEHAFGFFYCKVTAPDNLMHPIIQLHIKTNSGIRTVAPTGTFETMLFSEEINNAMKFGYEFDILWGYTFEKQIIFKDYIDSLYHMRLEYDKSNPLNFIAKILMNSLYGKFGMDDLFDTCIVIDKENLHSNKHLTNVDKINDSLVKDIIEIGDNFIVKIERDKTSTYLDNATETHNVNIGIASAITAYSRIYMSQFKNNPNLKLFYTDTDSIYTNLSPEQMNELYPGIISNTGLGKLKLETISKKAIFIAPKCYALETQDGNFICKVKGLTKDVILSLADFELLLHKDSVLVKNQTKWYKSLSEGMISVLEQSYTLRQTDNKRQLIFDNHNKLIATKPYHINEKKELLLPAIHL